jgi:hypothetical protein
MMTPSATCRIQFPSFGFQAATSVVSYLSDPGHIGHLRFADTSLRYSRRKSHSLMIGSHRSRRIRQGRKPGSKRTSAAGTRKEEWRNTRPTMAAGHGSSPPISCARFLPARLQAVSLLCMVLGPLLVWWACRILKLTAGRAAYAGALSIFYWWNSDLSEIAVTNGSVEFQITATGSLVVIADFLSFCETRASAAAIALLAISTLCLWLHPFTQPEPATLEPCVRDLGH